MEIFIVLPRKLNFARVKTSFFLKKSFFQMMLILLKFSNNGIVYSTISVSKQLLYMFFLYVSANLIMANKDIPFCHKLWEDLGNEMEDWRLRCLNGTQEITAPCCQAEKEYLEDKRLKHKEMCFYEGIR